MGTFIQYVAFPGIVTRQVGKETWKRLEIDFDENLVWDASNRNTVDASDFPEEVIDLFREDPEFKVVEADKAPKAPKQVTGEDYETVMTEANKKAVALDGGDGAGVSSSTADSTARTSASSSASSGGTGATRKSTTGRTTR